MLESVAVLRRPLQLVHDESPNGVVGPPGFDVFLASRQGHEIASFYKPSEAAHLPRGNRETMKTAAIEQARASPQGTLRSIQAILDLGRRHASTRIGGAARRPRRSPISRTIRSPEQRQAQCGFNADPHGVADLSLRHFLSGNFLKSFSEALLSFFLAVSMSGTRSTASESYAAHTPSFAFASTRPTNRTPSRFITFTG